MSILTINNIGKAYSASNNKFKTLTNLLFNKKESDEIHETKITSIDINSITNIAPDILLYTSIFTGVLITGLLLTNAVKK